MPCSPEILLLEVAERRPEASDLQNGSRLAPSTCMTTSTTKVRLLARSGQIIASRRQHEETRYRSWTSCNLAPRCNSSPTGRGPSDLDRCAAHPGRSTRRRCGARSAARAGCAQRAGLGCRLARRRRATSSMPAPCRARSPPVAPYMSRGGPTARTSADLPYTEARSNVTFRPGTPTKT
jgi:hypothetical protein